MIGRIISYKSHNVLLQLYKSLVRPNLEYHIVAWTPYQEKDKYLLEHVQHRFSRVIPCVKQLSYRKGYNALVCGHWKRQNIADLLEVFRTYKRPPTTSCDSVFYLDKNSRRRGHTTKIAKNRCHLNTRRHFFSL